MTHPSLTNAIKTLNLDLSEQEKELIYRITLSYTDGYAPNNSDDALGASTQWILKLLNKHGSKNPKFVPIVPDLIDKIENKLRRIKIGIDNYILA